MVTHQKPSLNCLEHAAFQVDSHDGLVDESQSIAHRHGLPQPVAPAHGVLLESVKLALVHWHHPMKRCLQQHTYLSTFDSAHSTQHIQSTALDSAHSTQHSQLSTFHPAQSTQHIPPSTFNPGHSTQHIRLSTVNSAHLTQHSRLSTTDSCTKSLVRCRVSNCPRQTGKTLSKAACNSTNDPMCLT